MLHNNQLKQIIRYTISIHKRLYPTYIKKLYPEAYEQINEKFQQLSGHKFSEKCYWILNDLTDFPVCENCKKKIFKYTNLTNGYHGHNTCKNLKEIGNKISLAWKNKLKNNPIEKEQFVQKIKNTKFKKYGDENWNNPEKQKETIANKIKNDKDYYKRRFQKSMQTKLKNGYSKEKNVAKIKQTCIQRYGVDSYSKTDEFISKVKETNQQKLGVDFPGQCRQCIEKLRNTNLKKYGCEIFPESIQFKELWKNKEFVKRRQQKSYETKRKNNSFHISSKEDECYKILVQKYGIENIERQYSIDKRYPFNCDFYIKNLDLFIEYNGHWTHGGHPFDNKNINDIKKINLWKERSKKSNFYKSAIETWTIRDVRKRKIAKETLGYKFIEIWNINQLNEIINV